MLNADKRKETRTPAAVPLYFKNGKGVTNDLAATGVFFWTESKATFTVGDHINFTVVISGPGTTVTSECSGEVVRVLARHSPKGVAVKLFHPALSRFIE
ncbi:MAG: PilZ domain-containing protein [Burkholderiales bacterium]|nr:PilZ domain-containing protein [Burkholderiales bacterium]